MSTIHKVEIVIDCEAVEHGAQGYQAVQMFADSDIVIDNSQGSYELSILVNNGDIMRWAAFPKVIESEDGHHYSVLIDAEHEWNDSTLIKDWTAYQGNTQVFVYESDAIPMSDEVHLSYQRQTAYQPYVQAEATLPGRPNPGAKQKAAYTFWVKVFKDDTCIAEINWDPYVTAVQP
ncbi:AidA/PixA family protein [Photobacterium sp. CCB-ST2H9]|uniref:AidA/PixA family protein n=1 Tax=unclassified Photobacterium TaxID=2628852 RepID=UPI002003198E|nr:AidA/PixA family protein [Photobacterium sp. CCB-ST2H9]UTM57366.1 AidA/PixA family protein [Photobacterium sp. CCB-ST2H9]